jgi:hypothetical protein
MTVNKYYDHYPHDARGLAAACARGAAQLRRDAAQALRDGDQARHRGKLHAAEFVERYVQTLHAGTANLDHAQIVAHAANNCGVLVDAPMPDDPDKQRWNPAGLRAEQELAARRKAELASAAAAGLICRVADHGQVAFYALPGHQPDGR